jgi:hypothetical protein
VVPGHTEDFHGPSRLPHAQIPDGPVVLGFVEGVPGKELFGCGIGVAVGEKDHQNLMPLAEEVHDGSASADGLVIRMRGEDEDALPFFPRLGDLRPGRDRVPPKKDLQKG